MPILAELKARFHAALATLVDDPAPLLEMIRPAQDRRHGDYQANFAMPLGKRLGRPPREVARELVERIDLAGLCEPAEIAGPGFINLRLTEEFIASQLQRALNDDRLGVPPAEKPKTYVVDFSSPNVAKPMHVGHIRSTVIGDAICRTLRFLGHRVVSDNHLGDWGTQFGMIIYGYKHFRSEEAYAAAPIEELTRLYRLVRQLIDYHAARESFPVVTDAYNAAFVECDLPRDPLPADKAEAKRIRKEWERAEARLAELAAERKSLTLKLAAVDCSPELKSLAEAHAGIGEAVLAETAKLHEGDAENLRLWREFMPLCLRDLERLYERLNITFDTQHGESFYHDMLGDVVADLEARGLARESQGATCVFLEGFEAPMIIRKRDGAFLYATTDLATIRFRMNEYRPDAILYVVGAPQADHFEKLFAAAKLWGYSEVELTHVAFGSVLGEDGKIFRTRAGDTVSLESLIDEAVSRAAAVVSEFTHLSEEERAGVAEVIGPSAIKYADLSHARTSDYVFSFDKMVALRGNTATYMQYSYARVRSIFAKAEIDNSGGSESDAMRGPPPLAGAVIELVEPAERALAVSLLRFGDALTESMVDYRPNLLAAYLFDLAKAYSDFYEACPVLGAEEPLRTSRLALCDLTARTLRQGLELLGIPVVERM